MHEGVRQGLLYIQFPFLAKTHTVAPGTGRPKIREPSVNRVCPGQTADILMATASTWCVHVLRSPKEAFAAAMQSWRERCEKCVCLQSDYVEK